MSQQRAPSNNTPQQNLELLLGNQITFGSLIIREIRRIKLTREQKVQMNLRHMGEALPYQVLNLAAMAEIRPSRLGQIIAEQSPACPTHEEVEAIGQVLGFSRAECQQISGHVVQSTMLEADWRVQAVGGGSRLAHDSSTSLITVVNAPLPPSKANFVVIEGGKSSAGQHLSLLEQLQQNAIDPACFYRKEFEIRGLTVQEVARGAGIPVSLVTGLTTSNTIRISFPQLQALSRVLSVPVKDLLTAHKRHWTSA